jgi:hypothetical protein
MFLERGGVFTHETVPQWETTVASLLTARLRTHRYGQGSRRWHVDETLIKVNGQWRSMSRALDPGGTLLAVRLSQPRDLAAARAFFRSAHRIATRSPLPGIGIAGIVYNYDGFVYASDESRMLAEMGDTTFKLGNVLEHSYEELLTSDALLHPLEESFTLSVPMCSDCAYEPFCCADPVYHYATTRDYVARKPASDFCTRNMTIFKYLIGLMESDPYAKNLFARWANRT